MAIVVAKFVDEKASEEYLCAICRDVMTVPVQIGCNGGHVYCRNCIIQYIQSQPPYNLKCPTCATTFHPNSVFQIPFIQRKINDLSVMCPNYTPNTDTNITSESEMKTQKDNNINIKNKNNKNNNINTTCNISIKNNTNNNSKQHTDNNNNNNNNKRVTKNKSNKCQSPLRRSKRIKEKQTKLSGLKRKQPDHDEDDDIIILNKPISKKQKLIVNNDCDNNINNTEEITDDYCEWKGRYGDLQTHIRKCPLQLINCRYLTIGCKEKIERKNIEIHMKMCEYCPILCPQCERTTISRGYLDNHLAHDCIMTMIQCNECKDEMKRMDLLQHKKKTCGETLIMCEYRNYGCDVIKRKDEKKHNNENMERHLKLIKDSHNNLENQVSELRRRLEQIERYQLRGNNNQIQTCQTGIYNQRNGVNNSYQRWHQT